MSPIAYGSGFEGVEKFAGSWRIENSPKATLRRPARTLKKGLSRSSP
jgi:hypothetical protein